MQRAITTHKLWELCQSPWAVLCHRQGKYFPPITVSLGQLTVSILGQEPGFQGITNWIQNMGQLQSLPQVVFCSTSMKTSESCIPVMPLCFEILRKKKSFPPSLLPRWLLRKSFCFYHMQNHIMPGFVVCKFLTTKCVLLITHPNAFSLTNLSSELSSLPSRPWDTHRLVCKSIQAGSVSLISMEFTNHQIKESWPENTNGHKMAASASLGLCLACLERFFRLCSFVSAMCAHSKTGRQTVKSNHTPWCSFTHPGLFCYQVFLCHKY